MDIGGLLTSAGINIAICVVLFSLYSILRKQPSNMIVYFGRNAARKTAGDDSFSFDRFVPSPSWILEAWKATDEDLLRIGGVDAVAFMRIIIFSMRIFSIAALICSFLVLPVNYYGEAKHHKHIHTESLEVFTIANIKEGSQWLWAHCLALYVISCAACILLYFEYKSITKMRLEHIKRPPPNPSHFTVLVRGIPSSETESYSETVKKFFTDYYASSYLSHQIVYRASKVQKLMSEVEKMYKKFKTVEGETIRCRESSMPCFFCGGTRQSFTILKETENGNSTTNLAALEPAQREKLNREECPAAFVFFKTRFAAVIAAQVLQSSNPMLWVTELAPEPNDVYWSNLCISYRQLWLRKIAILLAAIAFMFVFLIPVTFVQSLTQLEKLSRTLPFLRGILKQKFMNQVVTGYLPSVILILFLYAVPPTMMLFSKLEGSTSQSGREYSACIKVVYFTIWNVFFVNVLSGSFISQVSVFTSVRDIPTQLAKAVPAQVTFFMTYVLSSGWASLACEVIQLFALLCNIIKKFTRRMEDDSTNAVFSFPYHTEIPRLLLFGLLGFTCAVMAPLILPFLLVYYFLAYLVYRNQILNVYVSKYQTAGRFWPIVHNTTIFSLLLTQIIALGIFGIKRSPVASGFTIPLIILTLLFNEYCRQRFSPIFKRSTAQDLIDMDRKDNQSQQLEEIYQRLHSAYCQFDNMSDAGHSDHHGDQESIIDPESVNSGKELVGINKSPALNHNLEREGSGGKEINEP
ncbi:hypothetical protein SLE2022_324370 [Rubroshorea leprosula]